MASVWNEPEGKDPPLDPVAGLPVLRQRGRAVAVVVAVTMLIVLLVAGEVTVAEAA